MAKTILVIGATGQQGGAVARHLAKLGHTVRAVTRDMSKPAAQALQEQGMQVVEGDIGNAESLRSLMQGVDGVYSVQNFWQIGFDEEVRQGKLVADMAKEANISHLVYSSVGGAERNTGIPHFDSKWLVEEYIQSLGIPTTVFRPVFFMDNFLNFSPPQKNEDGSMTLFLPILADTKLQMIAVDDIGYFAALAFDQPDRFIGTNIELAGDELTGPQMSEAITAVSGMKTDFQVVPIDVARQQSEEGAVMFQWFIDHGYEADIEELRQIHPGLMDFPQWLAKNWK